LYANAVNFAQDPETMLLRFPLHKVSAVHLSGGHWILEPSDTLPAKMRLLDDHVHDVPKAVYALLTLLGQHAPQPLDVILEGDGTCADRPRGIVNGCRKLRAQAEAA